MNALAGRPRDVTNRGWFVDHDDGSVSYVIVRRAESGGPNAMSLAFHGETEAAALSAYGRWLDVQHERVYRNADRRSKWGPEGNGKMA
jgi:hypothetical protein